VEKTRRDVSHLVQQKYSKMGFNLLCVMAQFFLHRKARVSSVSIYFVRCNVLLQVIKVNDLLVVCTVSRQAFDKGHEGRGRTAEEYHVYGKDDCFQK
jgi:hypothetical protein